MGINSFALSKVIKDDLGPLYDKDFNPDLLCSDYTPQYVAANLQARNLIRKLRPKDSSAIDKATFQTFLSMNNRCRDWEAPVAEAEVDNVFYGEFRRIIDDFLHPYGEPLAGSYSDILMSARCGPGSSRKTKNTSFYGKLFDSSLSTTSIDLYNMYKRFISSYDAWIDAEEARFSVYKICKVNGSRISFVPKTDKSSRLTCTEPVLNMYYQLGFGALLETRLKQFFGIDLEFGQKVNQMLARRGSITGSYATIDLSSASDCVSLKMLEYFCPTWFVDIIKTTRSNYTEYLGETYQLYMASTMGNGFTFPLQTFIFASIVEACNRIFGNKERFAVYGDDIICSSKICYRVLYYLRKLGFIPNTSKTFTEGLFRESCGTDWFNGRSVRSVFIKKLDSPQDILVACNLLFEWGALHGIVLYRTIRYLLRHCKGSTPYVPFDSNLDSGLRVPLSLIINGKKDSNGSFLYKRFEPKILPLIFRCNDTLYDAYRDMTFALNTSGAWVAFMAGYIRDSTVGVRHDVQYVKKLSVIPYWNYIPFGHRFSGERLTWRVWERHVESVLSDSNLKQ